jgi:ABC-type phosphate/phosphonate transport system substrate-binding protein
MKVPLLALCGLLWAVCGQACAQADRPPLKFAIYSSLLGAVSDHQARGAAEPMLDLVSDRIGYPIARLDLPKGASREDLLAFGKKLDEGTYDVAAVWGLEYGWLRQKYPNLKVMAVVSNGDNAPARFQLMVRRHDLVPGLEKLKGKRLARFKQASLMDRLFLEEMLRKAGQDPQEFFQLQEPLPSTKEALLAVKNGEADCLMINVTDFNRFESLNAGLAASLTHVGELSDPYPAAVMIARPENLTKRRPDLWGKMQDVLLRIDQTEEGRLCASFWRMERLIKPDEQYLEEVEACARRLPIDRLLNRK